MLYVVEHVVWLSGSFLIPAGCQKRISMKKVLHSLSSIMLCSYCRTYRVRPALDDDTNVGEEKEDGICVLCLNVLTRTDIVEALHHSTMSHELSESAKDTWQELEFLVNSPISLQLREYLFVRTMKVEHELDVQVVPFREAAVHRFGALFATWMSLTLASNKKKDEKEVQVNLCLKTNIDDALLQMASALYRQIYPQATPLPSVNRRNSTRRIRQQTDPEERRRLLAQRRRTERSGAHIVNQQGITLLMENLSDAQWQSAGLLPIPAPDASELILVVEDDGNDERKSEEISLSSSSSSSSFSNNNNSHYKTGLLRLSLGIEHAPVFVSGRYLKLSREVSQSPWSHNDGLLVHTNVEDELMKAILPAFGARATCKFASSGREDLNVRMLGKGRPFFLKIDRISRVPREQEAFRAMEEAVCVNSDGLVGIVRESLCNSDVRAFNAMNKSVEVKKKRYVAVIRTRTQISQEMLDEKFAALSFPVRVAQQTPIRVLHTRVLATREKFIHSMDARLISPRFFVLTLETSSGTYVKEFAHSDRGRTVPSIKSILFGNLQNQLQLGQACDVDIVQLDVLDIF